MKIRKAVFPVAGLGTRVLPATKAMPKEMLTIVDKPLIQYVVDEAREAGIEHFIFVTGRNKGVIEDHFDRMYELDATLAARGKQAEIEILARDQLEAGGQDWPAAPLQVATSSWVPPEVLLPGSSRHSSPCDLLPSTNSPSLPVWVHISSGARSQVHKITLVPLPPLARSFAHLPSCTSSPLVNFHPWAESAPLHVQMMTSVRSARLLPLSSRHLPPYPLISGTPAGEDGDAGMPCVHSSVISSVPVPLRVAVVLISQ